MKQFLIQIKTSSEVRAFEAQLTELSADLFKSTKAFKDLVYARLPKSLADDLLECCGREKVDTANISNVAAFLESLQKEVQNLPVVTVRLAFSPKLKFVEKLSAWVKKNLDRSSVVAIEIAPELLGGVEILREGKFTDLSVRRHLEEMITEGKLAAGKYLGS